MGFYCLHESMLNSVLYARDRWLTPTGTMMPATTSIYAAPSNMKQLKEDKVTFYEDVYGLDFTCLQSMAMSVLLAKPYVKCIDPAELLAKPKVLSMSPLYANQVFIQSLLHLLMRVLCYLSCFHTIISWCVRSI